MTTSPRLLTLLLLALLLLPALPVGAAEPLPPASPTVVWHSPDANRLKYGIAGHMWWLDSHLDEFIAQYHTLGITSVRLSIDWRTFQPQPEQFVWVQYDRVLNRLAAEHIEVIGSFVTAPAWASSDPAACAQAQQVYSLEPNICDISPTADPQFRAAVRAVAARYPFIRLWEFWNEPEYWAHMGKDVADYLRWLRPFYDEMHAVNPGAVVAANTLAGYDYVDWLYGVSDGRYGPDHRPWDAISYHPYGALKVRGPDGKVVGLAPAPIEKLRARMVAAGDRTKKLWITEYGWEAEPQEQADYLRQAFAWFLAQDYIEVADLHMLHDWSGERFGLLTTNPPIYGSGRDITAQTIFVPKEPYYSTYRDFPKPVASVAPSGPGVLTFPTGHAVQSEFRAAWERLGGATALGPPRTAEYARRDPADSRWYRVQDFERGSLILRPARDGQAAHAELDTAGNALLQLRGWLDPFGTASGPAAPDAAPTNPDQFWFAAVGHGVAPRFQAAWQQAGGIAGLGLPRTGIVSENGASVQYFERGTLEARDETVQRGMIGVTIATAQNCLDAAGNPVAGTPAAREWAG